MAFEKPGLWIEHTEDAKFWLKVFNELRNRGLSDLLIAIVDGLHGFADAIETVYPNTQIQPCMVHLDPELTGFCQLERTKIFSRCALTCSPVGEPDKSE